MMEVIFLVISLFVCLQNFIIFFVVVVFPMIEYVC